MTLNYKIKSYLPNQYKEIVKNFSYVFVLRVVQQVIGFVSFFFIIGYVPKEVVGHYQFVLSVTAVISITALPGIRNALMQSLARGRGGFFRVATRYCFLGALLGSLILLSISAYYAFTENFLMAVAFMISALFMPATKGLLTWKASYSGEERFKMLSILDAGSALIVSLFLMLSVLFYTGSHILLLAIAFFIPAAQNVALCYIEARKYKASPDAEEGMVEYGVKISGYQIFPLIAQEVDKLSIYNFMSAGDLAAYHVAMKIPDAAKSVIGDLGSVLLPKFARISSYTPKLNQMLKIIGAFFFVSILIFTFTIFPMIFIWLVPDDYAYALSYSQVLLMSVAIGNHSLLRSKYIKSQKNSESFKLLMVVSTGIKIISVPILVLFFQLWGAVIAIFVQRIFVSFGVEYIIRKYHM